MLNLTEFHVLATVIKEDTAIWFRSLDFIIAFTHFVVVSLMVVNLITLSCIIRLTGYTGSIYKHYFLAIILVYPGTGIYLAFVRLQRPAVTHTEAKQPIGLMNVSED